MSSNKDIVLVDMDGPLTAFDETLFAAVTAAFGFNPFPYDSPDQQISRYMDNDLLPAHQHRLPEVRAIVNQRGWFSRLQPVPEAIDGIRQLAERYDVWICTKPLPGSRTCHSEKYGWLADHVGIGIADKMITASDKSLVHGAVLIDDAIHKHETTRATWKPVVYSKSYNKAGSPHGQDWPRWTWADGIDKLSDIINADRPSLT